MKAQAASCRKPTIGAMLVGLLCIAWAVPKVHADSLAGQNAGGATNYALLFEGNNGNTLQITNVTVNGNVGVGLTGKATDSGPSTINGSIDFSAAMSGQFSNNNASDVITGGVHFSVAGVTTALNAINGISDTLAGEAGTNVSIGNGGGQTLIINASAGILDAFGNRVFNVTGFNTTNGETLTINGDAAGDHVVLNFIGLSANFNNQVVLNGLNSDQVVYNFACVSSGIATCNSNLSGGPTLQINDNASSSSGNIVLGDFLDPDGAISIVNANVGGRVFGGDTHDFQDVSGSTITAQTRQVPEPSSVLLLGVGLCSVAGLSRKRLFHK